MPDGGQPTHETASATLSIAVVPPAFPGMLSTSWAGYLWPSSSLVTKVGATWTVPTLDSSATPNAGMSWWIGTGGAGSSSGDLLQTGVSSFCLNGVQHDLGWWEEFPEVEQTTFASFPVAPGDVIKAQVYEATTSGVWETLLDDTTTGLAGVMVTGQSWGVGSDASITPTVQGTTSTPAYTDRYSAEWIVEDFLVDSSPATAQEVPLADFGSVRFTSMGMARGPWYGGVAEPQNDVERVEGGQVLAVPGWSGGTMTVASVG